MTDPQQRAHAHSHAHAHAQADDAPEDPREFWEQRYAGAEAVWSGRVNRSLADVAAGWKPGRSLDLGCGEGGDVLWLASRGWDATGIDLSATAARRAGEAAAERGIAARFIAADLGEWAMRGVAGAGGAGGAAGGDGPGSADADAVLSGVFDLVSASFLQSPVELPRERILRAAAARVAPGGHLVLISHAAPPVWATDHPGEFPSPAEELSLLGLDPAEWEVEIAEVRTREARTPDGAHTELDDTVVVARRLRL